MGLKAFSVNIIGLSNKVHQFQYEFGDEFFAAYGSGLISKGQFKADVELNKHETFIEATFKITGHANLICDRSLDPFEYPIDFKKKIVFKYGDTDAELSDEIIMIHRDTDTLELGQYIYEFIGLEIPIKKLHPRYLDEMDMDDGAAGKIIYTSGESKNDPDDDENIDPRWEILKKLK
jgi:uncharacterized metal-binding protein YceD (DUF177 family)